MYILIAWRDYGFGRAFFFLFLLPLFGDGGKEHCID